ncbi:MAG: hypothetical protein GF368_01355 [Candidatus Aenigmarchaeota archaeon]|nr:hypothetical protein [Candidatus Aenigmarchaeota archaeon]
MSITVHQVTGHSNFTSYDLARGDANDKIEAILRGYGRRAKIVNTEEGPMSFRNGGFLGLRRETFLSVTVTIEY